MRIGRSRACLCSLGELGFAVLAIPFRKGLLDLLEDVLQLLHMGLQLVDPHADVSEPQIGVLLRGDRHVAEAAILVGEVLKVLVCGDRRLCLPGGREVPGGRPGREYDRRAESEEHDAVNGWSHGSTSSSTRSCAPSVCAATMIVLGVSCSANGATS